MEARQAAEHVILCGLAGLGLRTLQDLVRLGEQVVVIRRPEETEFVAAAHALGVTCVVGDRREESVIRAAGITRARAIVLTDDDDVGNLHAALGAQELNPGLRIVLRMFNQQLGSKIRTLFAECTVLSPSLLAAPSFVAAAVERDLQQRIEVAGHSLLVGKRTVDDPRVLAALTPAQPASREVFPAQGEAFCLVEIGSEDAAGAHARPQRSGRRLADWMPALDLRTLVGRRLRYMGAGLLGLVLVSTLVFGYFGHYDPMTALYFTVTTVTTTGFGDINLKDAPWGLKLYGISLMILGAAGLAVFFAFITDAIVTARLARHLGRGTNRLRGHIVVCGIGNIGFRIIEGLVARGFRVAASDLKENNRFLPLVDRLGVPVMLGDAGLPETLVALNAGEAACVMAVTNDDVTNLQTALNARELNPSMRVVLRLFDPDLAAKVERNFKIAISRSVSALAAPAFAAAALGENVLATLAAGGRVFAIAHRLIEPASAADGASVAGLEAGIEARVLALVSGGQPQWRPDRNARVAGGDELFVVATRVGLAQFLAQATARVSAPRWR